MKIKTMYFFRQARAITGPMLLHPMAITVPTTVRQRPSLLPRSKPRKSAKSANGLRESGRRERLDRRRWAWRRRASGVVPLPISAGPRGQQLLIHQQLLRLQMLTTRKAKNNSNNKKCLPGSSNSKDSGTSLLLSNSSSSRTRMC